MSDPALIDIEPVGTDSLKFVHGQECEPVLVANHQDRLLTDEAWKVGKTMKHVGRIPLVVWLQLQKDGIAQDGRLLRKWLEQHAEYKVTTKRI
jgi:hypothetical protein